jgi:hypothetical protein
MSSNAINRLDKASYLSYSKIYPGDDDPEEKLAPMNIQTSLKNNYGYHSNNIGVSFDILPAIKMHSWTNQWRMWQAWIVGGVIGFSILVVISKSSRSNLVGITLLHQTADIYPYSNITDHSFNTTSYSLPYNLRSLIRATSSKARLEGTLRSFTLSKPTHISASDFQVNLITTLQRIVVKTRVVSI